MEKRENKIGVRVSDSEKAKIEEKAKKESMELSEYIRNKLLGNKVTSQKEELRILCELSPIINRVCKGEILDDTEYKFLQKGISDLWEIF